MWSNMPFSADEGFHGTGPKIVWGRNSALRACFVETERIDTTVNGKTAAGHTNVGGYCRKDGGGAHEWRGHCHNACPHAPAGHGIEMTARAPGDRTARCHAQEGYLYR
jgi:hypothetical protein